MKFSHLLFIFLICFEANAQNIQTIAGGGPRNLPALQTGFPQPSGVAVDSAGNVYVSLFQLNQIWKISTSGTTTIFAGNGSFPYDADNVPATAATLYQPQGLAFDSAGNLYVADSAHNRVRKIAPDGTITTLAGTGAPAFGGDGGAATAAQLNNPVAVAVDSANNVYIVDKFNYKIRIVSPAGIINTFAGTGASAFSGDGGPAVFATLNQPTGIAVDSSSAVYIADAANFRIRKVVGGTITTIAGTGGGSPASSGNGGPALSAQLGTVADVGVDRNNNLFILEANEIREIPAGSANIINFAGNGTPGYSGDNGSPAAATFSSLAAIGFDSSSSLFVADTGNLRIRKLTASQVSTFAGNGTVDYNNNGGPALNASLFTPNTLALDNAGSLAFADSGGSSIRKLGLGTGVITTSVGSGFPGTTGDGGAATGPANLPFALTYDAGGTVYFVEGNRVRKVSGGVYSTIANTSNAGGFSGDGGLATAAQLRTPSGLALAQNGDLYVGDSQNHRVRVISAATGVITTIAGTGAASSTGDNGPATSAALNYPAALALDGAGNLFVCEEFGNRVRKIVLNTNIISTAAGDGTTNFADGVPATATGISTPFSIFADQSSNLFIADQGHSRVRKVTAATGIISTVAGNGIFDFAGDGGPATSAAVNPLSITIDRSQNLYIADSSGRIRTAPVLACFFTLSAPTVYNNSRAGSGTVTITATDPSCPYAVTSSLPSVTITSGASGTGSGTVTFTVSADPGMNRTATVAIGGANFTVAQAGVFGQTNVGFFQPSGPTWALDSNGNGAFDAADKYFPFTGQPGAIALVGDWNADGRAKAGYYLNGFWALDYNGNGTYDGIGPGQDKFYALGGDASYIPIVGDWNGDGRTKIGYYHNGFWALDTNGNGTFDASDSFFGYGGNPGEIPVVGDWNGDGRTKIGYFYQGLWVLDYDGNGSFSVANDRYFSAFPYSAGDKPVVGDWSGDGKTKIGIFRGGFWILDYNNNGTYDGAADRFYGFGGQPGDTPIVSDWNADGRSKVGVYNAGFWTLDFNGNGTFDGVSAGQDRFIALYGGSGSQPIIGRW